MVYAVHQHSRPRAAHADPADPGHGELLEAELGDRNEETRMIVRNARRLEELTSNIVEVSKIEANRSSTIRKNSLMI